MPTRSDGVAAPAIGEAPPLEAFRDRHRGERCFVVGTAPSLGALDLTRLAGEYAFTVNRGYLAAAQGQPTSPYYVMSDPLTYRPYAREVRQASVGVRFYRSDVCELPEYRDAPDREAAVRFPFHVAPTMDEGYFAEDAVTGTYRGFTVVLDAVQLAFLMGFADVFIIGCDLDYGGGQTHVYGTGPIEHARRDVMPTAKVRTAMAVAHAAFERHGRRLANAGVGGRLDTIPRVGFDSLF